MSLKKPSPSKIADTHVALLTVAAQREGDKGRGWIDDIQFGCIASFVHFGVDQDAWTLSRRFGNLGCGRSIARRSLH
jgi:hypothetical protein